MSTIPPVAVVWILAFDVEKVAGECRRRGRPDIADRLLAVHVDQLVAKLLSQDDGQHLSGDEVVFTTTAASLGMLRAGAPPGRVVEALQELRGALLAGAAIDRARDAARGGATGATA